MKTMVLTVLMLAVVTVAFATVPYPQEQGQVESTTYLGVESENQSSKLEGSKIKGQGRNNKNIHGLFCDGIGNVQALVDGFVGFIFKKEVKFYLYTSAGINPQEISCKNDNCDLQDLKFDSNLRTTVLVHGFLNDYKTDWIQSLKRQLFLWQDMNVIVVDWSDFNLNYYDTAKRVLSVAGEIRKLLQQIARKSSKDLKDWPYLHIIGHSLGAHVAGQTADLLRDHIFVHRVTALDPAKPYFDEEGASFKLQKRVAQFVDVIHSNCARNLVTFGLYEPLGHVDFYPNGGDKQPRCQTGTRWFFGIPECVSKFLVGLHSLAVLKNNLVFRYLQGGDMICDHGASQGYFIESINNMSKFMATKVMDAPENTMHGCKNCDARDCVPMGIHASNYNDTRYHGSYYVDTECYA